MQELVLGDVRTWGFPLNLCQMLKLRITGTGFSLGFRNTQDFSMGLEQSLTSRPNLRKEFYVLRYK